MALAARAGEAPTAPPEQRAQYDAVAEKSVLELQQFRTTNSAAVLDVSGREGTVRLIDLNPLANAWFVLNVDWRPSGSFTRYHLENPDPEGQSLRLAPLGLDLVRADGDHGCALWTGKPTALEAARQSGLPFAPLCEGRLYLRNAVSGRRSDLERVTDFLRDYVWHGEEVVGFVRKSVYRDAFLETGRAADGIAADAAPAGAPPAARLDPAQAGRAVVPENLGIEVVGAPAGAFTLGRWYAAFGFDGVFVSAIAPGFVDREILQSYPKRANPLDPTESAALDFLVAFDLARYDLGFALGTDHPRLEWSVRAPESGRPGGLPGPDGLDKPAPLIRTGMVSPAVAGRTVATFTGGFKRDHGAFRRGELAERNFGSHYGFVEAGVVLSKLQPGLATLYRLGDGTVGMATWSAELEARLADVVSARQNGVALIELDPADNRPAPGALVPSWGLGNWSGSADEKLRTLRAGACVIEDGERRFLVYGYFSTATPSAMARVFQAYGCRYAMLLDMNALEHTYFAAYLRRGNAVVIEHLVKGMGEVDKSTKSGVVPRFLGFPDNRDFFYVLARPKGD